MLLPGTTNAWTYGRFVGRLPDVSEHSRLRRSAAQRAVLLGALPLPYADATAFHCSSFADLGLPLHNACYALPATKDAGNGAGAR